MKGKRRIIYNALAIATVASIPALSAISCATNDISNVESNGIGMQITSNQIINRNDKLIITPSFESWVDKDSFEYQWQYFDGSKYVDFEEQCGKNYILEIENYSKEDNVKWRLKATSLDKSQVFYSNECRVDVNESQATESILKNQVRVSLDLTQSIDEHATLIINPTITYVDQTINDSLVDFQWYKNDVKISSQNNKQLSIQNIDFSSYNNASLKLRITSKKNESDFIDSNACMITVRKVNNSQQAISCSISIPESQQINENEGLSLTPTINATNAEGYTISYQWMIYQNANSWENLSGQTNKNLSLENLDYSYNGSQFKLVVSYSKDNQETKTFESNHCVLTVISTNSENIGILNVDYYLVGSNNPSDLGNRITSVFTKNPQILKRYGNVPLPWKADEELTQQDLVNMYVYNLLESDYTFDLSFGDRNISSRKMAVAYAKFVTEYWVKFPYLDLSMENYWFLLKNDNPKFNFNVNNSRHPETQKHFVDDDVLNYDWKVESTYNERAGKSTTDYFYDTNQRREMHQYYQKLFSRIRPGMRDIDKFYVCFDSVINWIWYPKTFSSDGMGLLGRHAGFCAQYAGLLALSLNAVGIKAIPLITNYAPENGDQFHANVWVYLDITGQDKEKNKKWYDSDPTWSAEVRDGTNHSNGAVTKTCLSSNYLNQLFLKDTSYSRSRATSGDGNNGGKVGNMQFTFSRLQGLIWDEVYKEDNSSQVGTASLGEQTYYANSWYASEASKIRSKFIFVNGSWYYLSKNTLEDKARLMKVDSPNGFTKKSTVQDVTSIIPSEYQKVLNNSIALMSQSNDRVLFFDDKASELIAVRTKNNNDVFDWTDVKTIKFNDSKFTHKKRTRNFHYNYFDNSINIEYDSQNDINIPATLKNEKFYLTDDESKIFDANYIKDKTIGDLENYARYIKLISGNYKVGKNYGQVTIQQKDQFYKDINKVVNDAKTKSNTEIDKSWKAVNDRFDNYVDTATTDIPFLIKGKKINTDYHMSQKVFLKNGLNFYINNMTNLDDLSHADNVYKSVYFSIYYTSDETKSRDVKKMTLVKTNTIAKFNQNDIERAGIENPTGYYKVIMFNKKHNTQVDFGTTHIIIDPNSESNRLANGDELLRIKSEGFNTVSNYSTRVNNWFNKSVKLEIGYTNSANKPLENQEDTTNAATLKLKFLSKKTKKITELKNIDFAAGSFEMISSSDRFFILNNINDDNEGIYFVEVEIKDRSGRKIGQLNSNFVFLMTKKSADSFKGSEWEDMVKEI